MTVRSKRLAIPVCEAKDAIGFGNDMPSFEIGKAFAVHGSRFDVTPFQFCLEKPCLFVAKCHVELLSTQII